MNIEVLIPRTRRAIDGPLASGSAALSSSLSDPQVLSLIADSIADVIFYTSGAWPYVLAGGEDVDGYGAPTSFTVEPDIPLEGQTVVVAQAALTYFFHRFSDAKVQETISNEAQTWQWAKSATLLTDYLKLLRDARDKALDLIALDTAGALDAYVSFIAVRDAQTSAIIEPYVETALIGVGQIDYRWG
jgi:hypothetical protein